MEAWQQPTLAGFLERLGRWNIPFRTVIDVGASNGLWTRDVIARFPDRQYFLVEARPEFSRETHEANVSLFIQELVGAGFLVVEASEPGSVE